LERGVDDYLSKPFEPRELVLRIRRILSRAVAKPPPSRTLSFGDCQFDLNRQELTRDGTLIRLTTTEASLLNALARSADVALSRETLSRMSGETGSDRAIDVQVTRLRRKIEVDPKMPRYLCTVRGKGYILRPD